MRLPPGIACLVLVASGVVLSTIPAAQAQEDAPGSRARAGVPKTEEQKSGEARFLQNCTLCHTTNDSRGQKGLGILARTELIGLYKLPGITDAAVRQVILEGFPGKMMAFKNTLEPKDVDDLIAYLRIR